MIGTDAAVVPATANFEFTAVAGVNVLLDFRTGDLVPAAADEVFINGLVIDISGDPPADGPMITGVEFDGGGNLVLDFTGEAVTSYQVTKSPDLVTAFVPLDIPLIETTDTEGVGQATVPASEASEAREFYRLEEVLPLPE